MKKTGFIAVAFVLTLLMSHSVFAAEPGSWMQEGGKRWYRYEDGTYPHSGWTRIDGHYYFFDSEGWMQADAVPAAEALKGLVADDILKYSRNSGEAPMAYPDAEGTYPVEKAAYELGRWVAGRIPRLPGYVAEKAAAVNNRHEWCFGTDVSNSTENNFPSYYAYYFALKEYYQSNGAKSADTYRGLLSDAEFFHEEQAADYVRALYDDLRPLITDFNNLIRAQH